PSPRRLDALWSIETSPATLRARKPGAGKSPFLSRKRGFAALGRYYVSVTKRLAWEDVAYVSDRTAGAPDWCDGGRTTRRRPFAEDVAQERLVGRGDAVRGIRRLQQGFQSAGRRRTRSRSRHMVRILGDDADLSASRGLRQGECDEAESGVDRCGQYRDTHVLAAGGNLLDASGARWPRRFGIPQQRAPAQF